ncbi:vanillate O-demethylase ferredoxin subunit [Pseudomonas sp. NFIX10]|uniref:PDR/VanB family oxidoreductase n=1 Tax=unclassified Pseudomonas TaxID=196821 RepID=UPI0008DFD981|nr:MULTISPECIES: PDR/VanB family oxidoreductase [unclassified Pseudomonas]SFA92429.1 vanillate O-demethylase ferredoxin subunit [Pseudomonas sp. NFIX10]SFE37816.1 vanillate O-demethylase ferredoxin subunit [Pseudomonas sp. NFACC06-1]
MSLITTKVTAIRDEAIDIRSFELRSVGPQALPQFTAGAHIDVHIASGLIRQYSLWNSPVERDVYRIAVKRESQSRGGSSAMHDNVRVGDTLLIGAPRNNFGIARGDNPVLLLAGGIGITPLLSMAYELRDAGRLFALRYFTRSPAHTAFYDQLAGLELHALSHLHHENDPDRLRQLLAVLLGERAHGADLYVCGPRPFMDLVQSVAAANWPADAIHREYFGADPIQLAGAQPFRLHLARSGRSAVVGADETITSCLTALGVDVPTSCEQGVCGTCLTTVLEGVPDHRDNYLTDDEKRTGNAMCLCVSRALSEELVLDI